MKIKEFRITRYGPLPETGRVSLGAFNLFFGKNEDGKTLTIDALVKLLLSGGLREFDRIDRVGETPEGYVVIEEGGEMIKLPDPSIRGLADVADISPAECRNIFIVRNSDLSIGGTSYDESGFYASVTDRLTGLRTKEIARIKKTIRDEARLTPKTWHFKSTAADDWLGDRINRARQLAENIEKLMEEIRTAGFDKLEVDLARLREDQNRMEKELDILEKARRRKEYEESASAFNKLEEALKELETLKVYTETDKKRWWENRKELENCEREENRLQKELEEKKNELNSLEKKIEEENEKLQKTGRIKEELDRSIKPALANCKIVQDELAEKSGRGRLSARLAIASIVLITASLAGIMFRPSPVYYAILFLSIITAAVSLSYRYIHGRNEARLTRRLEEIKKALSKLDLKADRIEDMQAKIKDFENEFRQRDEHLHELKGKAKNLRERIEKLKNEEIPDLERKRETAQKSIEEIKKGSGVDSSEEYEKKLDEKFNKERARDAQISVLKSHLSDKGEDLDEKMAYWRDEIRELEKYRDEATNVEYSKDAVDDLKRRKSELEQELKTKEDTMRSLQNKLRDVERQANEILLPQEHIFCDTSLDLEEIKKMLENFVSENEQTKDDALAIIGIFDEIEREEKSKISALFGKDSAASRYFATFTDGLYHEIAFVQDDGKADIKVLRSDGVWLDAEKLSGGAYDQLYFSIRLALGEKLLANRKGFFILDDPFIKADPDRLKKQLDVLKSISKAGWQIIYFSAKGEVKEALEEDIDAGTVKCIEIPGIRGQLEA